MRAWLAIAFERSVFRRAFKMAFVVGCILAAINHGDVLLAGEATIKNWVQICLTFVVPYCVSTYASVQAIRQLANK